MQIVMKFWPGRYIFQSYRFSERKLIEPQQFTVQKFEEFNLVKSARFQFLIKRLPQKHVIYRHQIETPSQVLKKPGIHIFPSAIPQINRRQKYNAVYRKIQQQFEKSYRKCKEPNQYFHLNRKINTQIHNKMEFIGVVQDKYKHHMLYKPYHDVLKQKTKDEYMKKGVKVNCLDGITIYPKGEVWMPTNEKYLQDFIEVIKKMEGDKTIKDILDIGCGSGILSFLAKKSFKKAKIICVDSNKAAVDTTNINAAQHHFDDILAFQCNIHQNGQFNQKLKEHKAASSYDLILINPPWIQAKKLANQSELENGVYDQDGKMLEASLKTASKMVKGKDSKILLIYSDLSKQLNLQKKSVEQICRQNSLLIHDIKQRPLSYNIQKFSILNQFKQKSKFSYLKQKGHDQVSLFDQKADKIQLANFQNTRFKMIKIILKIPKLDSLNLSGTVKNLFYSYCYFIMLK